MEKKVPHPNGFSMNTLLLLTSETLISAVALPVNQRNCKKITLGGSPQPFPLCYISLKIIITDGFWKFIMLC